LTFRKEERGLYVFGFLLWALAGFDLIDPRAGIILSLGLVGVALWNRLDREAEQTPSSNVN